MSSFLKINSFQRKSKKQVGDLLKTHLCRPRADLVPTLKRVGRHANLPRRKRLLCLLCLPNTYKDLIGII